MQGAVANPHPVEFRGHLQTSRPRVRSLRLLLLVLMLVCLPLPGWAAAVAHAVASPGDALTAPAAVDDSGTDPADAAATGQPSPSSETAEPQLQPGADLAEQLLPAPPLRLAAWSGRAGPPRYAGALLPEPDLPLLPRPPRA
ncbi:hypothetical protein [Cupriavidus necator]|uniref:hypothetical protein n=1 Tax=Cupriavidus necator TaxID=106590 RepID=UPI002E7945DF|nr:hypothetical protein [Cupriavidus necator]